MLLLSQFSGDPPVSAEEFTVDPYEGQPYWIESQNGIVCTDLDGAGFVQLGPAPAHAGFRGRTLRTCLQ